MQYGGSGGMPTCNSLGVSMETITFFEILEYLDRTLERTAITDSGLVYPLACMVLYAPLLTEPTQKKGH